MNDDRVLVRRLRTGDEAAFAVLYDRYRAPLLRVSRIAGAEAEDVVQETFVRLWQALPKLPDDVRIYPYAYVVARRLAVARAAQRDRYDTVEDLAASVVAFAPPYPDDALSDAVSALPEQQRDAVGYRLLDALPRSVAAARLGVAPRDLDALVERALHALRHQVRPPGP